MWWTRRQAPGTPTGFGSARLINFTAQPPAIVRVLIKLGWLCAAALVGVVLGYILTVFPVSLIFIPAAIVLMVYALLLWVMPDLARVPLNWLPPLFAVTLILAVCWPMYIAVDLPGLPWLQPARVAITTLAVILVYCLSASSDLRKSIRQVVMRHRLFYAAFGVFILIQFLNLPLSGNPFYSFQRAIIQQIYWTSIFVIAFHYVYPLSGKGEGFRRERFISLAWLLSAAAAFVGLLAMVEYSQKQIIWLNWLPAGFSADSDYLTKVLEPKYRMAAYRAQGPFTLPLTMAEFLVLALPFAMYLFALPRALWMRAIALGCYLSAVIGIFLSGARLGIVGLLVVHAAFLALFVGRYYLRERGNLFIGATAFLGALAAIGLPMLYFASGRIRSAIVGPSAIAHSNQARYEQMDMAVPHILSNPLFGYGLGQSAGVIGYVTPGGQISIDIYWLSLVLDLGLIGFVAFAVMILFLLFVGVTLYLKSEDEKIEVLLPVMAALFAFIVIKLVLAQTDNHWIVFGMLGVAAAFVHYHGIPKELLFRSTRGKAPRLNRRRDLLPG